MDYKIKITSQTLNSAWNGSIAPVSYNYSAKP